ncbi:unnamed protein product [Cuscuta campestris]|uniref:Uncharacterized protein n=1 Tax=Cuscuta campestris TaxID=132261 RepID=A0A484N074_9ASTE|nr:unnamed protein product [Cuscuta campestris]
MMISTTIANILTIGGLNTLSWVSVGLTDPATGERLVGKESKIIPTDDREVVDKSNTGLLNPQKLCTCKIHTCTASQILLVRLVPPILFRVGTPESFPRLTSTKTQGLFKFDESRALEICLESNQKGKFIRIAEDQKEGLSFLLVPFRDNGDGFKLFYKVLHSFLEKISLSHKGMTTNSEEIPQSVCIQNASYLGEALATTTIVSLDAEVLDLKVDEVIEASTSELGSSPQQSQLHSSTKVMSRGKGGLGTSLQLP